MIQETRSGTYGLIFLSAFILFLSLAFSLTQTGTLASTTDTALVVPTPTPFLPLSQSTMEAPILLPPEPLANSELLASVVAVPAHPPMELLPLSPHTVNLLLTGSDTRQGFPGVRTDTIMIISFNMDQGTASVLSIPRDLYVYLPDHWMARINTAEGLGGTQLLAETIQYNLGIVTHYYAKIDFNGFISVINLLGGVDLENNRLIIDTCDLQTVNYPAGSLHLDGQSALCYARVRKASSDFDRIQRQQQIIAAAFRKAISLHSLTSIPELYETYHQYVNTDLELNTLFSLLPLAVRLARQPDQIRFFSISRDAVSGYTVPETGASVLLPEDEAIRQILEEAFLPGSW
ncbi:MAG: LCP family protein [Anaerolineales bacterium]|nr:LCP family protein [Anaerolineales bacterium]